MGRVADIYAEDARPWLAEHGLWVGTRSYDDAAKSWMARSGHYLEAPPVGAFFAVSVEPLVPGLFGPVPSGAILGLAVLGRPNARMLPQNGTWAELTRFALDRSLPREAASHALRVAIEIWAARPTAVTLISYHDRSRHSGCIYKKAGMRKDGVTRAGTRRGSWGSRGGREQAVSSQEASKRRWRVDAADVRAAVASRADCR